MERIPRPRRSRPRLHPTPRPRALGPALLAASLAGLVGCSSLTTPPPDLHHPTFLAYWAADRAQPGCSAEDGCVTSADDLGSFLRLIETRRDDRKLELFRFDARETRAGALYAGAWRRSDLHHRFKPDLTWDGFDRLHRRLSREGYELLHLKVYDVDGRQRIAAIWRTGEGDTSEPPAPARVEHNRDWKELRKDDETLRRRGFHLAEIEVYRRPDGPDERWVAGVWQPGAVETRLLTGLRCERPFDHQVSSPVLDASGHSTDLAIYSRCNLLTTLESANREGFQAVDFERYVIAGVEAWAVLLHRRSGADWLRFPASKKQVGLRAVVLNPERSPDEPVIGVFGFTLLDFDLLDLPGHVQSELRGTPSDQVGVFLEEFPNHNGLAHDGGTAGPPGG